jgi:nanoRNase/pAp phosphatase (c-di-AMP/oligoRNAs hydrolase)
MPLEEILVDETNATDDDIKEALAELNKKRVRKAKIARGEIKGSKKWEEMTEEEREEKRKYNRKRNIKVSKLLALCEENGITVSQEEIDEEYAKQYPEG